MVLLHIKRGDESQFLYETNTAVKTEELIPELCNIYNGRLKIHRICMEMEQLAKHGTMLPPDMLGLTEEQIEELKRVDTWGETCIPSGGCRENKDPLGRRNGKEPGEKMQELIARSVGEVRAMIHKKQVDAKVCMTEKIIKDQLDILRGTCMIIYPMNLPPHDPIRMEFENKEDLAGTQDSLMVLRPSEAELWFCGKQIFPGKKLGDFIGNNEKTKVVLKLQRKGQGAPGREPVMTEAEQKNFMAYAYKKQEEAKRLADNDDDDDDHLNAEWADGDSLKKSFHGIKNISWKPK